MKRSGPLRRKTRLRSRNPKRRAKQWERNFGERSHAVRSMPCVAGVALLCGGWRNKNLSIDQDRGGSLLACKGPVQAAHAVARGMGGCKGDRRSLVPLCALHHLEAGERGTTVRVVFEDRYLGGRTLVEISDEIARQLDDEGYA